MTNRSRCRKEAAAARLPLAVLLTACLGMLLGGCGAKSTVADQGLGRALAAGDPPRRVAILPFSDRTDTDGLAEMVRTAFYSRFSALPYEDMELHDIDALLREHGIDSGERLARIPVADIGRILGVDAVVIGEVTEFDRVFAVLYSQLSIGAAITIYGTRSGRKLWNDRYVSRFHEGGLPLGIISIPLITMRSGYNLRETVKLRAVDELSRELVGRIPAPAGPPAADGGAALQAYAVQTGAFLDERRAIEFQATLRRHGFEAFIRKLRRQDGLWHRVLVGPYTRQEDALEVQERIRREMKTKTYICRVPEPPAAPSR